MPSWLKTLGGGLTVALLGFAAFMAAASATRQKQSAQMWKDRAVEQDESDVEGSADLAKEARARAKIAGQAAVRQVKKTKERLNAINSREPTMADVTSRWRKPREQ